MGGMGNVRIEKNELVSKQFISMKFLKEKKKKSLKTHILNRNEVTDGQGSVQ